MKFTAYAAAETMPRSSRLCWCVLALPCLAFDSLRIRSSTASSRDRAVPKAWWTGYWGETTPFCATAENHGAGFESKLTSGAGGVQKNASNGKIWIGDGRTAHGPNECRIRYAYQREL